MKKSANNFFQPVRSLHFMLGVGEYVDEAV